MESAALNEHTRLLADAEKLRGVSLEQLGYYGDPADDDEDEDEEPFYDTEEKRAAAEREARLLAGCVWNACEELIAGLFDDIDELRQLDAAGLEDARLHVIRESNVLRLLPSAFARHYTVGFAQRFLLVAADLTTGLAAGWESASCTAQEIAVGCLGVLTEQIADEHGIEFQDAPGTLYEALLQDIDFLFLYDIADVGPVAAAGAMEAVGASNMGFDDWFKPFSSTRGVAPYAYPQGADDSGFDSWEEDEQYEDPDEN